MKRKANRLISFVLTLAMLVTSFTGMSFTAFAEEVTQSYQWKEVALDDVTCDDTVALTMSTSNGKYYAISNESATNTQAKAATVNVNEKVLTFTELNPDDYQWTVTPSTAEDETKTYVISSGGRYLSTLTSKNTSRVNGNAISWGYSEGFLVYDYTEEKTEGEGDAAVTTKKDVRRYLGIYENTPDVRAYTSIGSNIKGQSLHVFKKVAVDVNTEPIKEACANVTASVESGEVEAGTEVTLSCSTEGAEIYYNTNSSENYSKYESPIVITQDTVITAYAQKEGLEDSSKATFTYTIKQATEEPELPDAPTTQSSVGTLLKRDFYEGDQIAIVYANENLALTATANGKKLNGTAALTVSDNTIDFANTEAAILTVSVSESGAYQLKNADGKYLTSGATGSALTFEETATDYSLWKLEATDTEGNYRLANANAKYGTSAQYLEYYKGFTTYTYKSASDAAYVFNFYCVKAGSKTVLCDKSVEETVAQFAGNANYEAAGIKTVVKGDHYETNDMLDENAEYSAVVSGKNVQAYTKATSTTTGSISYYMGATGVGSGTNDYLQLKFSSYGYGNIKLAFRLRASNTAAGEFQAQYSTDGETFTNLTTGTYACAYTAYASDGSPSDVNLEGDIKDGICKTSLVAAKYVSFTLELPSEAANADTLYIRLVPGKTRAKGEGTPSSSGAVRIDSIVVTGNPVVDESLVGFVSVDPEAGQVALGSELTLSTKTEGATIYYSVNDNAAQVYDPENKPVLSELPARVTAFAVKEGLTNSITRRFAFTQAQCANVKATPNGGAITSQTKVSFKCTTEDAKIYYSYEENGEFVEYTTPFLPKSLPCDIYVKATKDGFLDSAVSKLSFTAKTNDKYGVYFGQIHAHTNYSDGSGSCEEAFQYASKVDNLDYIAITDHSNSLDNAANAVISKNVDTKETDEWTSGHALAEQYSTEDFACVYGYEMTWSNGLGHMNTFNTPGFQSRTQTEYATYSTALQNYYKALNTVPDSISMFNHPGTTFGDFSDFSYYTEANDSLITMIEVGNGEGAIGSSGYFPSYEYYTRALDKGWHVAPTNNQDNHKGKWGDANTARTVMLSDTNDEAGIYDAMRNYRLYATEDNDLSVYYTLDGNVMGTILEQDAVGDTIELAVELKDPTDSKLGKVEVIVNGGLSIANKTVDTNEEKVTFTVPSNYSYYYIKITEADGDIAVTAPVWVGEVEACGINKTYTNSALAVQGESLDVNVDLYNNEKSDLTIDNIKVTLQNSENEVTEICNKSGAEAGVELVKSNGTATFTLNHLYDSAGKVTYEVTINATLNGVAKTYTDKLTVDYVVPQMVTKVIVDGTHYNDYVAGYYGGNVTNLVNIAAGKSIDVQVKKDTITAEDLADCALLVISAPAKKSGTANSGDYTVSHFEDEFLAMVADYVKNGGSVIVCGMADYQDTADGQTATEQNKLLEAIGSTIRMNSDEVYDEVNNGGQAYRLYPTTFDMESPFMTGVVDGQTYSQYAGCSVDVSGAKEATEFVSAARSLVKGFDTTYSIDCKDANGASAGNTAFDNKGDVTFFAQQSTTAGGNIFVAGGVFCSDFEVKAEMDNNDSKPYVNYTLINNILDDVTVKLPTSTIAEARAGEMGDVFAVEGYVTSGTSNEYTTFFDTIYIQDDTAGIDIFPYAEAGLEIGTKMRIIGFVSAYQGDKELKVISVEKLSDEKNVIEAKEVDTKTAMDYDALGGSLLKTTGKVTRVEMASDGTTLSEFWIADETGVEAAIFIDGYIYSGTTGKNELASFVEVGATVTASGILYMHPEGDSEESVPVFRVRNCDDIVLVSAPVVDPEQPVDPDQPEVKPENPDPVDPGFTNPIEQKVVEVATAAVTVVKAVVETVVKVVDQIVNTPVVKTAVSIFKKLFGKR